MMVTLAWPPPSHMVCRPYRPPVRSSSFSSVVVSRPPSAAPRICRAERLARRERAQDGVLAHVLHAARDHQVGGAGHDSLRREHDGLLAGPALPVGGQAGHVLGQARDQTSDPFWPNGPTCQRGQPRFAPAIY
jgi:hypothetical protein